MKSNVTPLYPNAAVAERVTDYAEQHSTALPKHIIDYHDYVDKNDSRSNYMISNFQGQCHFFLSRLVGAKRILEIGVYVGYSSLVWSHAVGKDGSVTGLEFSEEYTETARRVFKENKVDNVEIVQGDALQTLPALNPSEPYDLVFIDAQKSGYPDYLKTLLAQSKPGSSSRLLRPGALIIADNILRRALVADESDDNPHAAEARQIAAKSEFGTDRDLVALREYNDLVVASERLETFMVPLYDGMSLTRLVD